MNLRFILLACFSLTILANSSAQRSKKQSADTGYKQIFLDGIKWRHVGPFRGGRSAAVTGVPDQPNLYYFGATGGGIWKTTDAGNTWSNISDGYFGGSIGAIAVSDWDPNVIYVGGGEKTVRGNVSFGYGLWKSLDAGKSWKPAGLPKSRHISRIRIHPKNPNIVYAAVMGDLYQPTSERGVYKSTDGGNTWNKVLFTNQHAGAVDLCMDPTNPRVLYATTWRIRRTPYSLESGGEGSALWKSTDAGETWTNISTNKGLPEGIWGIAGVAVSPLNAERVWAIIENENGGVYRSEDGGATWKLTNSSRALRQRAWYYTRIYADTQDEDKVYVLNVDYHVSKDGGETFESARAPHGDHHDLWIAPENANRMIIGDDGGAQVSFDAGANWSTYHNQPTTQIYRVTTDNAFPYRIYGAQQDNSTLRIAHRTDGTFIGERDWEPTAGGESAHLAVDPTDNDIVYGGSYDGFLTRYNHRTKEIRAINVWPDNPMGWGAEGMKYRFQWNFPIFFSKHDPKKLYTASNHLHVTYNEGQAWEVISPDLTRNDPSRLGPSGGPITKDNTSVEYYCTIFAAVESLHEPEVIYTGSDDGLVHITRDGGKNWTNITPTDLPEWTMINSLEVDPHRKGGIYLAGTRYKLGDYTPILFKSYDYGETWQKITKGIPEEHFTRVLLADPERKDLLFAGTESGMYISFDGGSSWSAFQQNLPVVPITDLALKNNNLIASTQGRGFWLIDDLTPLHQLNAQVNESTAFLFKPMDTYRLGGGGGKTSLTAGTNHPGGALVHFYLKDTTGKDTVRLTFRKGAEVIKVFSSAPDKDQQEENLPISPGFNTFQWDMRYADAKTFDGMILWWATTKGPVAPPGNYEVELAVGNSIQTQQLKLMKDPRSSSSVEDLKAQFDFLISVRDKLSETHQAIQNIRSVRDRIAAVKAALNSEEHQALIAQADSLSEQLTNIEKALYQTKNESRQDPLNFPIRLNNKLGHLASLTAMGDYPPTEQAILFYQEVRARIDEELGKLDRLMKNDVVMLNEAIIANKIQLISTDE